MDFEINNYDQNYLQQEIAYDDLNSLNKKITRKNNLILYLNIRSLNANFERLQIFIKRLNVKPYVIICAESWKLDHYLYYKLNGYNIYYNNGNINKSDGVVVYVKENLEQITNTVEIGRLKILNLKKYLNNKRNVKNHFVIGDFNINIGQNNNISQEFISNFLEKGFLPGFTETTRPYDLTSESGSCLDNMFIKTSTISTKTFKLKIPFPDHYPLFIDIKKTMTDKDKENHDMGYNINYKKLFNTAHNVNWSQINQIENPNEAIQIHIKKINECIEIAKCKTKKEKNVPRKGWITSAIIKSCNKKEKLYKKLKINPNDENIKYDNIKYLIR